MCEQSWMKKPCDLCPFSRSRTLFLHPERAEEFAYMAQNPYTDFPCHKTAEYQEETLLHPDGFVHDRKSLTCNGFLSLQVNENGRGPERFCPDPDSFEDAWDMIEHHTQAWEQS